MHTGSYVQVRYPGDARWVTVAVSDGRAVAARFAADAFLERRNVHGELPAQVRIATASQLVYEGGELEVGVADADMIAAAGALPDRAPRMRPEAPGPRGSDRAPRRRHARGAPG